MRDTTLTMVFNTERLDALTYHMGKTEADLQVEMNEYLDDKIAREAREKEARPKRPRPEARMVNHSQEVSGENR